MTAKKETTLVVKKEKKETVEGFEQNSSLHNLITFFQTDQDLLHEVNEKIDLLKDEKKDILDRLKESRRDLSLLMKYASPKELEQLEALGFEMEEPSRGLNPYAQCALDIVNATKDNRLTNNELYIAFVESLPKHPKLEHINYTAFNIKLRSLFNSQILVRKTTDDGNNSRTDILYLNSGVKPTT